MARPKKIVEEEKKTTASKKVVEIKNVTSTEFDPSIPENKQRWLR